MKTHTRERLGPGTPNHAKFPAAFSSASSQSRAKENATASVEGHSSPVGKACIYFARGYCKHGSSCRFAHPAPVSSSSPSVQTSPRTPSQLVTSSSQESNSGIAGNSDQRWLHQLQSELQDLLGCYSSPLTVASLPHLYLEKYGKILQSEGPESEGNRNGRNLSSLLRLLGKLRGTFVVFERPDGQKAVSLKSPCSRQIYLTFPCESTFTEADVASHFGAYGTVNDVRIPYQQRRMFGFVTFASASPVKSVLKQVNPHLICGSRVLVKPYKDKPKASDRYKYGEASRGPSTEPTVIHKGPFESRQLPPRHVVARSEGAKVGVTSRSSLVQSWKPVRNETVAQNSQQDTVSLQKTPQPPQETQQEQAANSLSPDEVQELDSISDIQDKTAEEPCQEQEAKDQDPKTPEALTPPRERSYTDTDSSTHDIEKTEAVETPIEASPTLTHSEESCDSAGVDFGDSPLPRVKLFQEYDGTPHGTPGEQTEGSSKEEQGLSPLEDWSIDLESILPDSPFSSQRQTPQTTPKESSASEDASGKNWQPSSLPNNSQFSQAESWGWESGMAYNPHANAAWSPQEYVQGKYPQQMVHSSAGIDDGRYGTGYVSGNPYHSGSAEYQYGKDYYSANRAICTTCRQQQVLGPNSQCGFCLQMMCHNMGQVNHLVPDMGSTWHVPVNAYVRASPQ